MQTTYSLSLNISFGCSIFNVFILAILYTIIVAIEYSVQRIYNNEFVIFQPL